MCYNKQNYIILRKGEDINLKTKIIVAIIGALATIIAAFIGLFNWGKDVGQRNTKTQIKEVMGDAINVIGDGNDITINDIGTLAQNYIQLQSDYKSLNQQKDSLVEQSTQYFNDLNEANSRIKELQSQSDKEIDALKQQINDMPVVSFLNLGLCVDGDDKVVNATNSVAMINGKEYWNKELVQYLIEENKSVIIQDSNIYIGKVITEKANLLDQYTMDRKNFGLYDTAKDSFGNTYSNVLIGNGNYNEYRMYNVNREFSYLKFKIAAGSDYHSSSKAIITILADDEVIYTSDEIFQTTEPFEVDDLPINNCLRLKIKVSGNSLSCVIVSDAVLYN